MNEVYVDGFAFQVPIWIVLPVLALFGIGVWKLVKLLALALRG